MAIIHVFFVPLWRLRKIEKFTPESAKRRFGVHAPAVGIAFLGIWAPGAAPFRARLPRARVKGYWKKVKGYWKRVLRDLTRPKAKGLANFARSHLGPRQGLCSFETRKSSSGRGSDGSSTGPGGLNHLPDASGSHFLDRLGQLMASFRTQVARKCISNSHSFTPTAVPLGGDQYF